MAVSYILDALPYHLVSATIYCFIRGDSTSKSKSSLLCLSLWDDCHVKSATFCTLGRATFDAVKRIGAKEHLLVKGQA